MNAVTVAVRWRGMDPPERLLHALERRYAAALPRWRRRQWVAGRLTARVSLRLAAGTPLAGVMIMPGPDGAPTVLGGEDRELSLSHTTQWAASACGPAGLRFGIDIETPGACDQALLARVSGPGETPVAPGAATVGWARKEAAFKACRGSPSLLRDFRLTGDSLVTPVYDGTAGRVLRTWWTHLNGAVLAVASDHPVPPPLTVLDAHDAVTILDGALSP
jgi:4'-phosphopantetheinyl transferase EntD